MTLANPIQPAPSRTRSAIGRWAAGTYRRLYEALCGRHPYLRPWHFQWLSGKILYTPLRELLAERHGSVLDVGCGDKPYERWMPNASRYVGVDVEPGPRVDYVIQPGKPWPLQDGDFDLVLCTQVLEHVVDRQTLLEEVSRVLRPGGALLVTAPFIYGEHARPHDYWRYSLQGGRELLSDHLTVVHALPQGGVGSSIGAMLLAWLQLMMTATRTRSALMVVLLPAWVLLCALVNAVGWLLDELDRTESFYGNVLIVATKA